MPSHQVNYDFNLIESFAESYPTLLLNFSLSGIQRSVIYEN